MKRVVCLCIISLFSLISLGQEIDSPIEASVSLRVKIRSRILVDSTNIEVILGKDDTLSVELFNKNAKKVKSIANNKRSKAGKYIYTIYRDTLKAGFYLLQIETLRSGMISEYIEVSSLTNADESKESQNKVEFYPNPFQNQIYYSGVNPIGIIKIFSCEGVLVKETNLAANSERALDLSELAAGFYFIKYNLNDKPYQTKIIKR